MIISTILLGTDLYSKCHYRYKPLTAFKKVAMCFLESELKLPYLTHLKRYCSFDDHKKEAEESNLNVYTFIFPQDAKSCLL